MVTDHQQTGARLDIFLSLGFLGFFMPKRLAVGAFATPPAVLAFY
jgi:hypothetical protein